MLSYQHGYHAGNFADVIKHLVLTRLLCYMTRKDKPMFYLDTHAGRGSYDLQSGQALKTKEAFSGIHTLMKHQKALPDLFNPYLNLLMQLNPDGALRYYPGSPLLSMNLLRPSDRLFFSELHPQEFPILKKMTRKNVCCQQTDGLSWMKALLPPKERRGLIFIDPAYERDEEYQEIPLRILDARARFKEGVYCLWYPIVQHQQHAKLLRALSKINASSSLRVEFYHSKITGIGMAGCGLWVINPPYVLEEEIINSRS